MRTLIWQKHMYERDLFRQIVKYENMSQFWLSYAYMIIDGCGWSLDYLNLLKTYLKQRNVLVKADSEQNKM